MVHLHTWGGTGGKKSWNILFSERKGLPASAGCFVQLPLLSLHIFWKRTPKTAMHDITANASIVVRWHNHPSPWLSQSGDTQVLAVCKTQKNDKQY
jgi:hypothetical protein